MSDVTMVCTTLDDIIQQPNMPKIIVIGGGGLGKTTLINRITNVKLNMSDSTQDGTIDFQGAAFRHKDANILLVDSPGFHFNEEKWWNGILQIKKIIGVIVMYKYEHRNSGYANFGYVLAYLNQQAGNKVKKFLLDHTADIGDHNYMAGSTPLKNSDHDAIYEDVLRWIEQVDVNNTINIYSPVALIKQYHDKLEEIRNFERPITEERQDHRNVVANHRQIVEQLQANIDTAREEKQIVENQFEQLKVRINEILGELANYDDQTGGYLPDAPHGMHYLYSWLPFAGTLYLNSLRTKAEKNHSVARRLMRWARGRR